MKHFTLFIVFLLSSLQLAAAPCAKKDPFAALKKMTQAEKYYKANQLLIAMDTACSVLRDYPGNHAAKDFIHTHWGETMEQMHADLLKYNSQTDLHAADTTVWIYTTVTGIQNKLQQIGLPLRGKNDAWVWTPEIEYWDGHLSDAERLQKELQKKENERQARLKAISRHEE